jgi:formate hydrogenlyase subunit 6/NADH:ubiquinone oxidoreductase subunit I
MLKLIKKVLKTGPATVAYPAQPLAIDPNFRGKPEYSPQQCIACGACANACPSKRVEHDPRSQQRHLALAAVSWPLHLLRPLRGSVPNHRHSAFAAVRTGSVA